MAQPSDGIAYVHRIIAYEKYGESIRGNHAHHINGDVWDWSFENIELLSAAAHAAHHNTEHAELKVTLPCGYCGVFLEITALRRKKSRSGSIYCSTKCNGRSQERVAWPIRDVLTEMVSAGGYEATGRALGVTGAAVKKRVRSFSR